MPESREDRVRRDRRMRQYRRDFVNARKQSPCVDCGVSFHPVSMDFDHVNDDKIADVSGLVGQKASYEKIQEEIDKCELVCSNCHRLRTHYRNLKRFK